jgi:hypothetical protein
VLAELGTAAAAAYDGAGGWRRFREMTESSAEFVRRDFLACYVTSAANARADEELRRIAPAVANRLLGTPAPAWLLPSVTGAS